MYFRNVVVSPLYLDDFSLVLQAGDIIQLEEFPKEDT
jgi:hypothetical protein